MRCYNGVVLPWVVQVFLMFLSVKELEIRKIRFDETFAPRQIDFTGEDLVQGTPLHATGTAELLPESGGQLRVSGRGESRRRPGSSPGIPQSYWEFLIVSPNPWSLRRNAAAWENEVTCCVDLPTPGGFLS